MDGHVYDSWGTETDRFANGAICIGIDLGTTNSCVGIWKTDRNHVKIIKNQHTKHRTTPSVVYFDPNTQDVIVGEAAIALESQETSEPGNTIRTIKRLMGQSYDSKAVAIAKSFSTYTIVPTPKTNHAAVKIHRNNQKNVLIAPEQVSTCILTELKASAEAYWASQQSNNQSERIDNVVITVPAYFSDSQRRATMKSAIVAGFKGIRLLNEPTAAAMAYGLFLSGQKQVVVFDFGGGTLDVSLMRIDDGKFEVLGIGGDTNLGGEDINAIVLEHVLELLQKHHGIARDELSHLQFVHLKAQVESAKIGLSTEDHVTITVHGLKKDVSVMLTRRKFELLCESIWKRCLRIVHQVLKEADVAPRAIDEVILVGGSTRIPILRTKISEYFDRKELCMSVNADEVVCEGAAIQAAILSGMDSKVFRDVLMMDVIPLPIGLEKADGDMEILLPKNARIPVSVTKHFETYEDQQPGLTIEVYEGESTVAKENDHICYFNCKIPKHKLGKAGEFLHPVTFTMNASGVLQVQAGIHHDEEEAPMSKTGLVVMGLYLVALMAFYVFFRMYFATERDLTL